MGFSPSVSIHHAVDTGPSYSHESLNTDVESSLINSSYHLSYQSGCRFSVNPHFHTSGYKGNTRDSEPMKSRD